MWCPLSDKHRELSGNVIQPIKLLLLTDTVGMLSASSSKRRRWNLCFPQEKCVSAWWGLISPVLVSWHSLRQISASLAFLPVKNEVYWTRGLEGVINVHLQPRLEQFGRPHRPGILIQWRPHQRNRPRVRTSHGADPGQGQIFDYHRV